MTPAIMFQGTGSDVGKSLVVAGLCRLFARQGLNVRPFKPQNMSNNAAPAVGPGGIHGEIGRAQALQARAANCVPVTDMNPVLLKPQSDVGAQVVVDGTVVGNADARAYHGMKPGLMATVLAAFARLSADADLVLVEGAGSPAEVNLRTGDIANMGFAEAADIPVILIGDIERGGVIAALVGTWTLLPTRERARLQGYIVNRFRGDPTLFDDAFPIIEQHTGLPSLGILPWFDGAAALPAEDSASLEGRYRGAGWSSAPVRIAVPKLSRISNFDDLDPLAAEPDCSLRLVGTGETFPEDANLILLVGSKSTRADMAELSAGGHAGAIRRAAAQGTSILGICGGYQMLGRTIADPQGAEGPPGTEAGLGLLDAETVIAAHKTLAPARGRTSDGAAALSGYEMHMGRTTGPDTARPFAILEPDRPDGARAPAGHIAGTYLHGLFASDDFRHACLSAIDPRAGARLRWDEHLELALDRLADHIGEHIDTVRVLDIAQQFRRRRPGD